jgi:hypothetical protein
MAGLSNKDSSFFEISSPDIDIDETIYTQDMMSLTVQEEMGKLTQGTFRLNDPNGIYARILRTGVRLFLAWGYKDIDAYPKADLVKVVNRDEFSGSIERRGIEVMVLQPSGSGEGGKTVFNANFTSVGFRGDEYIRVFRSGNKRSVISTVLSELGISMQDIRFQRMGELITPDTEIRQEESNFAFLTRLASREWRALFAINYTPAGNLTAVFIDPWLLDSSPFQSQVTGGIGRSNYFDYMGAVSNVISFKWSNNEGENAQGANVQMTIIDGKPTFVRYVVEDQTVITYRLVPERIRAEFERKGMDSGFVGQTKLLKEFLSVKDFESIKRFFDPIEQKTAPQGYGYQISIRQFGNPLTIAGNQAKFGNGFPDQLGNSQTKWYIRKVNHSINRTGYFQEIEIVDSLTFTPTGVVL